MDNNICLFVPKMHNYETIQPVRFVLERKPQNNPEFSISSFYIVHCVIKGEGIVHYKDNSFKVKRGDVFFTTPSLSYRIESVKDFEYGYITYLGTRASYLAEKFHLRQNNYVFFDLGDLPDLWVKALTLGSKFSDLLSESIVLFTFSKIGHKYFPIEQETLSETPPPIIKKYIDEHFSESDLSLKKISDAFSYNPKYVSSIFKKQYQIGIAEYITTIRVQNACDLIEKGLSSVNDISFLCGFNDPLYFSKVFKSKIGKSPKNYIKENGIKI